MPRRIDPYGECFGHSHETGNRRPSGNNLSGFVAFVFFVAQEPENE
jgi:hypothetical protein